MKNSCGWGLCLSCCTSSYFKSIKLSIKSSVNTPPANRSSLYAFSALSESFSDEGTVSIFASSSAGSSNKSTSTPSHQDQFDF